MDRNKVCSFFGHRKVEITDELKEKIQNTVKDLIVDKNVTVFLFGSRSQFDDLCVQIITGLKKMYPQIKCIYVRAEFQYISQSYEDYLLECYDKTYYPEKIKNAGKASYVERNQRMIDQSDHCIFYLNRSNAPLCWQRAELATDCNPSRGALAPQGFSGRLKLPLKF